MKNVQIIERDGKPEYAVVPYEEWLRLQELAEEAEDVRDARAAQQSLASGADESIPAELVKRLHQGESPLRVWREFRGLTRTELAQRSGLAPATIEEWEKGHRVGGADVLDRLARALDIDREDLLWPADGADAETE